MTLESWIDAFRQPWLWSSFIVITILIIAAIIIGQKVKKLEIGDKPNMFLAGVISLVGFLNDFTKNNVGKQWRFVAPHILTLAILLFSLNVSGIFGLKTPTAYTAITVTFALWAFMLIQVTGFRSRKFRHFGSLVGPVKWMAPIMIPINILSDLTPLLSMTLRIFGNIASGALIVSLVMGLTGWGGIVVLAPVNAIFDIGFGLIQTIVFIILTLIFIGNKLDTTDLEIQLGGEIEL